jgi:hypothetical protein
MTNFKHWAMPFAKFAKPGKYRKWLWANYPVFTVPTFAISKEALGI